MVEPWLDHDTTVANLQKLPSIKFASLEHAICHVIKHGGEIFSKRILRKLRIISKYRTNVRTLSHLPRFSLSILIVWSAYSPEEGASIEHRNVVVLSPSTSGYCKRDKFKIFTYILPTQILNF